MSSDTMSSDDLSGEERDRNLPPAASSGGDLTGSSGRADDQLGEELGDTADSVTRELRDLQDELMLPGQGGTPSAGGPVGQAPGSAPVGASQFGGTPSDVPPRETVPPSAPVSAPAAPRADRAGQASTGVPSGVTDDDRLLSMLSWLSMAVFSLPIVPLILLLSENTKNRSYQRHHAVTGLLFYAAAVVYEMLAAAVYGILLSVPLVNLAACLCLWVIFFVPHAIALYYAFKAYGGSRIDLPYLTAFGRRQGWL